MYNERKTTQMAVFFLHESGGRMSHLKLMKLLYLSDREAMDQYGEPITGDCAVAMPHGPVLSMTLNVMDGDIESAKDGWDSWISDKENHEVSLKCNEIIRDNLDELSNSDLGILNHIWERFGQMNKWKIRDYTHNHCPEWKDPNGSSNPISYKEILLALGKPAELADELSTKIEQDRSISRLFASL